MQTSWPTVIGLVAFIAASFMVAWLSASVAAGSSAQSHTECGRVGGASGRYQVTTFGVSCSYARATAFRQFLMAKVGEGGVWNLNGVGICVTQENKTGERRFGTCIRSTGRIRWARV